MVHKHIWVATVVVLGLHLGVIEGVYTNCGDSGSLDVGQSYRFWSSNFPRPYPGGLLCRWTATTPENSIVNLHCPYFDLRKRTSGCIDTFYYSPSGDLTSGDYIEYCGRGTLNINTTTNSLDVYLSTYRWNYNPNHSMKRLYCIITVIGEMTTTTPDSTTPDSTTPDSTTPEPATPDPTTPDSSMPDSTTPEPATPDPTTPEPATPDPTTPEPATPDPTTPEPDSTNIVPNTTPDKQSSCECGENSLQGCIVGGGETEVHEWPWQVALRYQSSDQQFCGGSLISPSWVLTAAHCVVDFQVSSIIVSIGEHDTKTGSDTSHTVHRTISQKISHNDYDGNLVINDIALIKLTTPVENSPGISPVCLPTNLQTQMFDGENATVTGWGTTSYQGSTSNILLEVSLPVISNTLCASLNDFSIRDDQVCTYEEGKDSCQGDSGGPLVWLDEDNGHYQQVGIVSYGIGCAKKNKPGVYTRVTSYIDWIQQSSNINFCSP